MDTDAGGQVGGMSAPDNVRKQLAEKSREYSCAGCGKGALAILEEQEERCKELGIEATNEEENPLLGKIGLIEPKKEGTTTESSAPASTLPQAVETVPSSSPSPPIVAAAQKVNPTPTPTTQRSQPPHTQSSSQPQTPLQPHSPTRTQQPQPPAQLPPTTTTDAWIDKAIIGIVIALVLMILRRVA